MKKILLSLSALVLVATTAQDTFAAGGFYDTPYSKRNSGSFGRGASLLSFSLGFPASYLDNYGDVKLPPLYAKYEYGVAPEVGVAFHAGVGQSKFSKHDKMTVSSFGFYGFYHFNKLIPVRNLDVYAGVGPVIVNRNWDDRWGRANDTELMFGFRAGARYYVTPNFGFNFDFGSDRTSTAAVGVTFNLR